MTTKAELIALLHTRIRQVIQDRLGYDFEEDPFNPYPALSVGAEVDVWETIEAELQAVGFAIVPIDELHPVFSNWDRS
jgi:hypothetical protein